MDEMQKGSAPDEILNDICLSFEANSPGARAGVTMLDPTLHTFENATFPSLSPEYARALQGIAVADKPGSCALAVYEGRTVVSTDVATDSRFAPAWKDLGLKHGLEALVSIPAKQADGVALGTFVVAYPPKSGLSRGDLLTADAFAELCGLVLSYRRSRLTPGSVAQSYEAQSSPI
nr:GAF domain-containing protein [Sphingomonas alba]